VALEGEHSLALERIPHVAVEIVVSSEQVATADGERDGGDAAEDVVVCVLHELAISADVEQAARCVVGARPECQPIGEVLYSIDIGFVPSKCLHAFARSEIPELGRCIASPRNEVVLIWGDRHTHNIAIVVREFCELCSLFNVPQDARHITTASNNLAVVEEPAAGQITDVSVEFAAHSDGDLSAAQVVHGADVIQTSACNKSPRRRVSTSHHP